jgi:hypothetical protein
LPKSLHWSFHDTTCEMVLRLIPCAGLICLQLQFMRTQYWNWEVSWKFVNLHMRDGVLSLLIFPLSLMMLCVLMSRWWRCMRPSYDVTTHHQTCCLSIMVVRRSLGILDWESEARYACI